MKTVLRVFPSHKMALSELQRFHTIFSGHGTLHREKMEYVIDDTTYKFIPQSDLDNRIQGLEFHSFVIDEYADITEDQWNSLIPRIKR